MNTKYSLKIAHLYGDLMNTYGDLGNVLVLKYYGQKMGIDVSSKVVSLGNNFKASDYDLAVFGGGQDFEQTIVSKDIQTKKDELTKFIHEGKPMVAICGGYQLIGKYYIGADGERIQGIGALNHYTDQQKNHRFIGNIKIKNDETGEIYHGFENHQGITFLSQDEKPLGKVINGHGNNGKDGTEGAIYKNTYCTYFHGPILARNGQIAKHMLISALKQKYPHQNFTQQAHLKILPTF